MNRLLLYLLVVIFSLILRTASQGQTPTFWNKISLTPTSLNLYYGWSSNGERIFFRFRGINQGYLAIVFSSSLINADMIVVRQPSSSAIVEDRYSIDSTLSSIDTVSNVQYESGGFLLTTGEWDITFSRLGSTLDTSQDRVINTTAMSIQFFMGQDQLFTNRNVTIYNFSNVVFAKSQLCDSTCATCSGPEPSNCLSCELTRILFLDSCAPKVPTYWNRLIDSTTKSGFKVDYSIDSNLRFIYFKFRGTNNGWVALGFHNQMAGADIILVNQINSTIYAWDKYSSGYSAPSNDTQNDVRYISGTRSSAGLWDVVIVRPLRAQQTTFDRSITLNQTNNFLLAFANSDNDTQMHSSREIFVQYITNIQVCDSTCANCTGPDADQCGTCQTQYFKDSNNLCVICFQGCATCTGGTSTQCTSCVTPYYYTSNRCILCHSSCATCSGTSSNQCLTCAESSKIVIEGSCIVSQPTFWNSLPVRDNFTLFYGFDSSSAPTYIYFKARGNHQGWIGFSFGSTNTSGDTVRLRRVGSSVEVIDSFMASGQISADVTSNVYYIRGNRDSNNFWDVDFLRRLGTPDNTDIAIQTNYPLRLRFLFGTSDSLSNDFATVEMNNTVFNTTQIQACSSSCKNCIGSTANDCSACYDGQYLDSESSCRDCSVMCLTCDGATSINCLSCSADYVLEGTQCVASNTSTCHSSCETCNGTLLTSCLTCKSGYTHYTQNSQNYCLRASPNFWNYISKTGTVNMYYGFDLNNSDFIYFKLTGQNEGWVGLGFGHAMAGMDVLMIYLVNNVVTVTDRYSSGYTEPELDASNDVALISGTRDQQGNWNAVFVKKMRTQDPFDTTLEQLKSYPLSIVTSNTDETNVRHINTYIIDSIQLVNEQVCDTQCGSLGCSGPETEDCKIYSTISRGGLTSFEFTSQSLKLFQALLVTIVAILIALF